MRGNKMLILKNVLTVDIPAEMVLERLSKISAGRVKNSRGLSKFWFFLMLRENWGTRRTFQFCFVSGRTEKTDHGCQVTYCIYPGPVFWLLCSALAVVLILIIKSSTRREASFLTIGGALFCLILQVRYLERAGNRNLMNLLCDNKTYYYT